MIALFFDVLIDLIRHRRRRGVLSRRIAKYKSIIELDFFRERARLREIVVILTGKSDDDIGRN